MITDIDVARKLINSYLSAKDRNLEFNLTFQDIKRLLSTKHCFYTGLELNNDEKSQNQRTFDRVDNSKGYIRGNVVVCTKEFNGLKGCLTVEQIQLLVKGLKKKKLL